ncbi:MAG: ABC transporter permease [Planctomycetes bacterium]|nr:ABC transporter permease [Planctomycetota bacterium]
MTERAGDPVLSHGRLGSRPRLMATGWLLIGGAIGLLLITLVIPTLLVVGLSFLERGENGEILLQATTGNIARLAGFGSFGWSADYLWILARSLWVAGVATSLSLCLAYPLAFLIAARTPRWRLVLLALVAIPFCTNLVVRTNGWMILLSGQLAPAHLAQAAGLIDAGRALYPGAWAVHLGMVSSLLPFAVLPLYTAVERLDHALIDAARDLYASPWRVFRHAVLPQTLPGLGAATALTFIPAIGMFVVPDLLGGSSYMLVGNLLQQQFFTSNDWPLGAAIASLLIALTFLGLFVVRRLQRNAR